MFSRDKGFRVDKKELTVPPNLWRVIADKKSEIDTAMDEHDGEDMKFPLNQVGTKVLVVQTWGAAQRNYVGIVTYARDTGKPMGRYSMNFTFEEFRTLLGHKDEIAKALAKFQPPKRQYPKFETAQDRSLGFRWIIKRGEKILNKGQGTYYTQTDALNAAQEEAVSIPEAAVVSTESFFIDTWDLYDLVLKVYFWHVYTRLIVQFRERPCRGCLDKSGRLENHECMDAPPDFDLVHALESEALGQVKRAIGIKALSHLIEEVRAMIGANPVSGYLYAQCVDHFVRLSSKDVQAELIQFVSGDSYEKQLIRRAFLRFKEFRPDFTMDTAAAAAATDDAADNSSAKKRKM